MLPQALAVALIAASVLAPLGVGAAEKLVVKAVSVALPFGDRMFPDGPGSEAVNNNCLACHSAGMVLNQPELSKQAWVAEVNKMISAYKAPVAPEDVGPIVEYLSNLKGVK